MKLTLSTIVLVVTIILVLPHQPGSIDFVLSLILLETLLLFDGIDARKFVHSCVFAATGAAVILPTIFLFSFVSQYITSYFGNTAHGKIISTWVALFILGVCIDRYFSKHLSKFWCRLKNSRVQTIVSKANIVPLENSKCIAEDEVVNSQGITVYVAKDDERGKQLIKNGGFLSLSTLKVWTILLKKKSWTHILDVGANYGEMLVTVSLPTTALVYAFEPSPITLQYLKKTIRESELKIHVVEEAVSDSTGNSILFLDRNWSGTTRFARHEETLRANDGVEVKTTTLNTFLSSLELPYKDLSVLVKIDVEGHEISVLKGLRPALESLGKFAGLVEVLHIPDDDLLYLIKNFELDLFDIEKNCLRKIFPSSIEEFKFTINAPGIHFQDVVIWRK